MKRKIIALLLVFTILTLISCDKNREYDEGEVKAAAQELIEKSESVNLVFYGTGIAYDDDKNNSSGYYYPASEAHLNELGFKTISELKAKTKEVYTKALCEIIFSTRLTSVSDGGYVISLARYYEKEVDGYPIIMVYTAAEPQYTNSIVYLYDTLRVEGSKGELIYVTIDLLLTSTEGKEQTVNARLALLEESDGYRLDTLSFAVYNPEITK